MKYLVPYDFSPITYTALKTAYEFSKAVSGKIELLHIIESKDQSAQAEKKFEDLISALDPELKERVSSKIRLGNIFKDINHEAQEGDFDLIFMGTHGAKGLQKLFGSKAMKVVMSSAVPLVISQEKEPQKEISKIVLPVDLSHEKIQIVKFAADLAVRFKAKVHIVSAAQSDEFLINRMRNNITKVKRMLMKEGIDFELNEVAGKASFQDELIAMASQLDADLIALAHHPQTLIPQLEKFSQALITNSEGIPVLIVNAKELIGVKANYSFVGI